MFGQNWFFGSSIKEPKFLGLPGTESPSTPLATLWNILIRKDKYSCKRIYSNEASNSYVLPGQPRESTLGWTTLKQATSRPGTTHSHEEELVIIVVLSFIPESHPGQGSCERSLMKVPNNQTGFLSATTFYLATSPPSLCRYLSLTFRFLITASLFF